MVRSSSCCVAIVVSNTGEATQQQEQKSLKKTEVTGELYVVVKDGKTWFSLKQTQHIHGQQYFLRAGSYSTGN